MAKKKKKKRLKRLLKRARRRGSRPKPKKRRRKFSVSRKKPGKVTPRPSKGLQKKKTAVVSTKETIRVRKKKSRSRKKAEESDLEVTLDKTPMRIYLQQIEKIPLLTPDQEISLAREISLGGPKGSAARERMIRSNLRLVISIAKRYANLGLPFSDLVEEGNIGLMRAVDKFNYKKGYRFSTYASWWIKQAIMRALSNQGKTIRVPVYMFDTISRWRKMRESLIQKLGRIPTRKEIADAMEVPVSKVREIEQISTQPSSLNAPISLDGQVEIMDLIQDEMVASPDSNIEELLEHERINQLLNHVDERERQVLILRFGLKKGEPHTLEETAKQFGVTRERIRQIEMAAIKKIRYMLKSKEERLEDYIR